MKSEIKTNLILLFIVMALFSSCAKDKTEEEWKREKQAQQMSHIQDVSGIYSGNLDSTLAGGSAQFVLDVKPGVSLFANPSSQSSGVLITAQGRATVTNAEQSSSAAFEAAYFNQDTNELHAEVNINDASGAKNTLDIDGKFSDSRFDGTISNRLFPKVNQELHLTLVNRNHGVEVQSSALKKEDSTKSIKTFKGTSTRITDNSPIQTYLVMQKPLLTSEQNFLQHFSPLQIIDASFGVITDKNVYIPGGFHNCQYNSELGTLVGREVQQSGSDLISRILECKLDRDEKMVYCQYSVGTRGLLYSGMLKLAE